MHYVKVLKLFLFNPKKCEMRGLQVNGRKRCGVVKDGLVINSQSIVTSVDKGWRTGGTTQSGEVAGGQPRVIDLAPMRCV